MTRRTLILFWSIMCGAAFGYTPPVGIPNPAASFGVLDPVNTPNPTTSSYAPGWPTRANNIASGDAHDCYYIDNASGAATDTANPYGYPNKPRLTLPDAVQGAVALSAGAYVEIHGGGASYTTVFRPAGVGTAASPIWFVGVGTPVFTKTVDIGQDDHAAISYIIFDGLKIHLDAAGSGVDLRPRYANNEIDHIVFRNTTIWGAALAGSNGASAIGIGSALLSGSERTTQNTVLYNCDIGFSGNKTDPNEECGIYPNFWATNIWVLSCNIHDCAEDGIGGSDGGERTSSFMYVGDCTIHDDVTNGIDIKQMGTVVISHCTIFDHYAGGLSSGQGENIVLHYSEESTPGATATTWTHWPADVSVLFCTIYNGDYGVYVTSIDRLRIVGCVFYNIKQTDLGPWDGPSAYAHGTPIHINSLGNNLYVVNNTSFGCDNGLIGYADDQSSYSGGTAYFRGSVVWYPTTSKVYEMIHDDNWPTGITGISPTNATYWQEFRIQIWGNISAARLQSTGQDFIFVSSTTKLNAVFDFDYNDAYRSVGGGSYGYGDATARDLTWVQANTPQQAHGLASSPNFVNGAGNNFQLNSGSPAIAASTSGTGTTVYADYLATLGQSIRFDRNSAAQPAGETGWDMGAYRFSSSGITANRINVTQFTF